MGEWRFLFFTIAVMTRMFSSREMIPRMRNICSTNRDVHSTDVSVRNNPRAITYSDIKAVNCNA